MRLLFLAPQLPYPPHQGTAIRNWGLISHLAARHAITLVAFGASLPPAELTAACRAVIAVPPPQRSRWQRLLALASGQPDLAGRLWSPEYAAALRRVLVDHSFDLIQVEGLELAPYLAMVRAMAPAVPVVYDAHNAEHVLQRRAALVDARHPARWPRALYSALQVPRLRRWEAITCRRADQVTCVSAEDAAALRRLAPRRDPVVVANGIDLADYPHALAVEDQGSERLVFSGKMDYRPNVDAALWFAGAILPRIRAARPGVTFTVVGQQPDARLHRLDGRGGVRVTGAVPDTRPYIAEAGVYVAPLRMGGGTRFKLLEAMALGRPIVSTRLGAEGFAVQSGREVQLADDAASFARAVLDLLADPQRRATLGAAGRAFVQAEYDWAAIVPRLEELYAALGAAAPTPATNR